MKRLLQIAIRCLGVLLGFFGATMIFMVMWKQKDFSLNLTSIFGVISVFLAPMFVGLVILWFGLTGKDPRLKGPLDLRAFKNVLYGLASIAIGLLILAAKNGSTVGIVWCLLFVIFGVFHLWVGHELRKNLRAA